MRTALDSNILSALWSREPSAPAIGLQLKRARDAGGISVCAPVYAECIAHPAVTKEFIDSFLMTTGITVDFDLDEEIWHTAALGFRAYAERRRSSGGGLSKRFLVDFVVGAHALLRSDRLLTLDPSRYQRDFPKLMLV